MQIVIDGLNIDYEVAGNGEKNLLLLHGWGCDKHIFNSIVSELSKTFTVYSLDFAGFGKSSPPPAYYGVSDYANLTAKFIKNLGISKTDIICHSFGGRVAVILASKYPELVGKIVFTGSAGVKKKRTLKYYFKTYSFKLLKKLSKVSLMRSLFKLFGSDIESKIKNAGSDDYRALSEDMKQVFVRVVNEDLCSYMPGIGSPSLLIYGENDSETPVAFGEKMQKLIPDSGLVVMKGAGHYTFLDDYYFYIKVVKKFLEV